MVKVPYVTCHGKDEWVRHLAWERRSSVSSFCHCVGSAGELPPVHKRGPTELCGSFWLILAVTKVPS